VSTSDDAATAKGASECLQPAVARARSCGSFEGKNADGAGLDEEEVEDGRERNWGEREVEKRVAAMGGIGRIGLMGFWG